MRQGWLRSLLCALILITGVAQAESLSQQQVDNWLSNETLNQKANDFMKLALFNELDALTFSLSQLRYPQQEVVRLLMLRDIERSQIPISSQLALFVEKQSKIKATYQLVVVEDGYEFSTIAFPFPQTASRIISSWQKGEDEMAFYLLAEKGEINLSSWLNPQEESLRVSRKRLLVSEFSQLSTYAQQALVKQVTQQKITTWLPESEVLTELARVTGDEALYALLWKTKPDQYIRAELDRLAKQADNFAMRQIVNSTLNPKLYDSSLSILVEASSNSIVAKDFIVGELGDKEVASNVARQFVILGKQQWLIQLIENAPTLSYSQFEAQLNL
jgi:hypothetical protein